MRVMTALRAGVRAVGRMRGLWWVLYLCNLAFAGLLAAPVFGLLGRWLDYSLYAEELRKKFEPQVIAEWLYAAPVVPPLLLPLLLAGATLYLPLSIFLTSGTLALFNAPPARFTLAAFFQACGRHFFGLLRLFLLSLPFYVLALAVYAGLGRLAEGRLQDLTVEWPAALVQWGRVVVALSLLAAVNLVFDYARIFYVAEGGPRAWRAAGHAARFVLAHPLRAPGLYALIALIGLAVWGVYLLVAGTLGRLAGAPAVLLFLLQQLFILARLGVRLLFLSAQVQLYKGLRPAVAPPEFYADY